MTYAKGSITMTILNSTLFFGTGPAFGSGSPATGSSISDTPVDYSTSPWAGWWTEDPA
jgi:hypothetical protein